MIANNMPAYRDALLKMGKVKIKQIFSKDIEDIFREMFTEPLSKIQPPDGTRVILIDALDELPANAKTRVLRLISENFLNLPEWLRLFITSRNEAVIKMHLRKFSPYDLLVNEQKNLQDLRTYLRSLASPYFKDFDVVDLKVDIRSKFRIEIKDEILKLIGENFLASRMVYDDAVSQTDQEGLKKLQEVRDVRPPDRELRQQFSTLREGYVLCKKVHPMVWKVLQSIAGSSVQVLDGGLKTEKSAERKLEKEYDGDASRLKDLVRFSIIAEEPSLLLATMQHLETLEGWKMISCKNKYASPTPLGYRDVNTCFRVSSLGNDDLLIEIQFHLKIVIEVKEKAHKFYEKIRVELPNICKGSADQDKLQAYIKQRLDSSVLDAAVEKMEKKTEGLFVYAKLLGDHIERVAEKKQGKLTLEDVTTLPDGLDEVYQENFSRVFPGGTGDERWQSSKQLVALIVAAREPIPVALAREVLKWNQDAEEKTLSNLSLLFPVRQGRVHVYHKTVVDWLQNMKRSAEAFYVSPKDVASAHERLAHTCLALLEKGQDTKEFLGYPLKFVLPHTCQAGNQQAGTKQSVEIQNLRNRAMDLLLTFDYLYRRVELSPVKLLEDVVALEEVVTSSMKKESERQKALKLLRSGIRLSMQGLLFDFR